jgi:hypothetical protein
MSAARAGAQVCLVQPTGRLGGQYTDQALPAPDEGPVAKAIGDDRAYSRSQSSLRARMRSLGGRANPGSCWVSPLCTSISVAARAFDESLQPFVSSGALRIFSNAELTGVLKSANGGRTTVTGATFRDTVNNTNFQVNAIVTIEATDLGDVLELGAIPSRVGTEARADTGEAPLPVTACPRCQQSFTFGIVAERAGSPVTPVAAPSGYLSNPWLSNYTDTFWTGSPLSARSFYAPYSIFNYRRLTSSSSSVGSTGAPGDVVVLNWGCQLQGAQGPKRCGNDYGGGVLVGVSRSERAQNLTRGRERAQGYVRFLQTGAAPDLRPRPDLSGAAFGLAAQPYIREARRGIASTTIVYSDINATGRSAIARAKPFWDSVGLGDYFYMDTHPNDEPTSISLEGDEGKTKPFAIPLGALVPVETDGLILSSKSLGTTHLTNAAYRMHPVEWAIGEASGAAAALAVSLKVQPRGLLSVSNTRRLQYALARSGVPIYWLDDVSTSDPDFADIELLAASGTVAGESVSTLRYGPENTVNRGQVAQALVGAFQWPLVNPSTPSFSDVPASHPNFRAIETLKARGVVSGFGDGTYRPQDSNTRLQLKYLVLGATSPSVADEAFARTPQDGTALRKRELARVLSVVARRSLGIP